MTTRSFLSSEYTGGMDSRDEDLGYSTPTARLDECPQ